MFGVDTSRRTAARSWVVVFHLVVVLLGGVGIGWAQTPVCSYAVVNVYPHDDEAFTQGLLFADGEIFESTGNYGESSLRRVALETGQVLQHLDLGAMFFAEGLAMWGDQLLQLTWQENTCFVWDAATFTLDEAFIYTGEGWGLTHDGRRLIMSDGSSTLRFRNPNSFNELDSIIVFDSVGAVANLNELEWIRSEVFANQFLTDRIARIDPSTGEVIAWIDLSGLLDPAPLGVGVLNGIAWDDAGERLFVTGKHWPSLFEIELVGCPELRLFFDGFERGDTQGWSSAQP